MIEDTIVAIATPPGKAGVAIVRISGNMSEEILKKISKTSDSFISRHMYLKNIYLDGFNDNALLVYFKSPNSYTGEDVAEIQCHGGYFVAEEVLKQVLKCGARLAGPGEFSKRAFLNGKMSIDQAEGVMDIINAETKAQASVGSELIQGKLFEKINGLQARLTDCIAEVEAKLDYPEYDFEETEEDSLKTNLYTIKEELERLISTTVLGSKIKNGVKVAIVGRPNVGKSSLLNALTNTEKAIVTDIAGTTRDIVEAEYVYNGILFILFDTAGIHESDDFVEKIGIERAIDSIKTADIVLKLQEVGENFEIDTFEKPVINVYTKLDLHNLDKTVLDNEIYISSVNNTNIEQLKKMIFDKTVSDGYDSSQLYLTNNRHVESLKDALSALERALDSFNSATLDFVVSDLNICWHKIGEVTGQTSNEDIIDRIFEKFCLGK